MPFTELEIPDEIYIRVHTMEEDRDISQTLPRLDGRAPHPAIINKLPRSVRYRKAEQITESSELQFLDRERRDRRCWQI